MSWKLWFRQYFRRSCWSCPRRSGSGRRSPSWSSSSQWADLPPPENQSIWLRIDYCDNTITMTKIPLGRSWHQWCIIWLSEVISNDYMISRWIIVDQQMSSGRSLHSASILTSSFKFQILDNKFLNCDTTTMTNKYHLVDPHIQPLNVHLSILSSGGIIGEIQICKMSHFYTEQSF